MEYRKLSVIDYTTNATLKDIRRIMMKFAGLLAVVLRMTYLKKGFEKR
ncbi:hypothetical protein [Lactobacillus kimbladii]|nr:hypothetical protein [Lactobacillus kimbladii]